METLRLTPDAALDELERRALELVAARPGRSALGLAGGPGAGKSTLAEGLVARLNAASPGLAAFVPMDGFHMRHARLEALGTTKDKGAPHTFEGEAFAAFLSRLKASRDAVTGPLYSRKIEDVVDDAFTVAPDARLLVTEGNYLLLADPPWDRVRPLLDLAAFIAIPRETARARLTRRHAAEGLFSPERNREHIERVDLVNFDLVSASRPNADLAIDLAVEG